jgi:hypothetical protein
LSECLAGVGDSLGVDVAGRSPGGDFLPVSPGEYPLDREHLGGLQSCLDAGPRAPASASSSSSMYRVSRPARLGVVNTSR